MADGAITGTLKYVSEGALASDWGPGNFIALKFVPSELDGECSYLVGLEPSAGSGLVELDEDMDGVFKVSDKDAQKFVVITSGASGAARQEYDLSGLTVETA